LEKGLNSFKFYHLAFALSFNHITNKDKWLYKNQYLKGYLQELVKHDYYIGNFAFLHVEPGI
jgi:hypothetical protein